eukprot:GILK01007346.1.p1 GENE.GILK01007346.1~~GILK01007346.1.p1  ORF type:complete len:269 (+),score=15.97 GILK01007346.1:2-808(+)
MVKGRHSQSTWGTHTDNMSKKQHDAEPKALSFSDKIRYAIPNAFTVFAMLAGLYSVTCSVHRQIDSACWSILLATFLDKADGILARALRAQSDIGGELDSFSDFISFGVAPAFLLEAVYDSADGKLGWPHVGAAIYIVSAAFRLAKYNLIHETSDFFTGLPTTLSGGILAMLVLVLRKHEIPINAIYFSALLVFFGVAMNSNMKFSKLNGSLSKPLKAVAFLAVGASVPCLALQLYPEIPLTVAIMGVAISAFQNVSAHRRSKAHKSR